MKTFVLQEGGERREGEGEGSKQELVKSLIVLQSVSTVLTEAGCSVQEWVCSAEKNTK